MTSTTLTRVDITTTRLRLSCWTAGRDDGVPLLLVHGNLVSGWWWYRVAAELSSLYRVVAPDLRGFGLTDPAPVDATNGLGDFSADLRALLDVLGWSDRGDVHAAGWSMGGAILQRYLIDHPADLASLTLVAPVSPYGFGGTGRTDGTPYRADFTGSGAGGVSPEFLRRLGRRDRGDHDCSSPRIVMRRFFASRGLSRPEEDRLLDELLLTRVGPDNYPGDTCPSPHWPYFAPGSRGVHNAMSPRWHNTVAFVEAAPQVPLLWLRGGGDRVISDQSVFDASVLGERGVLPGWPGRSRFPPQPQVGQTRMALERRRRLGATVRTVVMPGAGHGLVVSRPRQVASLLERHIRISNMARRRG